MEELVSCKLCSAVSHLKFNIKGYVQHVQLFHVHQANFMYMLWAKAMCDVELESNMHNCDHDYDTTYGCDYDDNSDTVVIMMSLTLCKELTVTMSYASLRSSCRNLQQHFYLD